MTSIAATQKLVRLNLDEFRCNLDELIGATQISKLDAAGMNLVATQMQLRCKLDATKINLDASQMNLVATQMKLDAAQMNLDDLRCKLDEL